MLVKAVFIVVILAMFWCSEGRGDHDEENGMEKQSTLKEAHQDLKALSDVVKALKKRMNILEKRQGCCKDGAPGKPGKDGKDGVGIPGKAGTNGLPGKDGSPGKDGAPGKNGRVGLPGPRGRDGRDGQEGAPGPRGKDGKDGVGIPGKAGINGLPGKDGSPGKDGAPGKDGGVGSPGPTGRDGRDGQHGAQGPRGNTGSPGARGAQGPQGPPGPKYGGVQYIRWGKTSCPSGANLIYKGRVGGAYYAHSGGGSNYVCLTDSPKYQSYTNVVEKYSAFMYGAEYELDKSNHPNPFRNKNLHNHDVPCAVCFVPNRNTKLMMPATYECPAGWSKEYWGYLMAAHYSHPNQKDFICVDENPDVVKDSSSDRNGALLYGVQGRCGALPCLPYVEGRELTCAVCTK